MSDTNGIRTRIASELNRSLTDVFGNSGETFATAVNREINAAVRHYESMAFLWNSRRRVEFTTTANGVTNYSLPADFISMRKLEIIYQGSYYEIFKGDPDDVDRENYRQSMTAAAISIPRFHTIEGNMLVIAPPCNGAATLAASYTRRYLPTSVTGCFTAQVAVGGTYSMTVTTTASHNNRSNGWTTACEELIRERAKASLKVRYLKNENAILEAASLAARRAPFFSIAEEIAFERIRDETFDALAMGVTRSYPI